jgi:dTDP-4-dehydrorhamnose reductase
MPDSEKRILLTGVIGQVGGELQRLLQPLGSIVPADLPAFDLLDTASVRKFAKECKPDWIVNPAAYTAVDKAESEPDLAYAINAEAPRVLGEVAAELGIPVIHFSTDYVFNGSGTKPWVESDHTGPLGVYGASKLAGELALARTGVAHLIFRTSWVYGSRGKNFLLTILPLAFQKEELRIVDDQYGAPTWSRDLARMVVHVMRKTSEAGAQSGLSAEQAVRSVQGIYHAVNQGETSWFGFAQEFLRVAAQARPAAKIARLVPISSSEYPSPAKRPANSRLDCSRLRETFGFSMPAWEESAAAVVLEVLKNESVQTSGH